ncbi:bifunctional helix-turn-helix transcriptional regulator/GNAT family N-acetyltransferase [Pseudorhodoplanes sp.]|uniref:bifunctional helix-turn-helix transcriptional regulator/GNAT family N-acetyltransferase n=1 Tax=Pseudorhodoplanes sp. TaxID=1934341 RepID=UPI003D0D9E36
MSIVPDSGFEQRVGAVRRFARFYTRRIGLLDEGLLESPFSLTQARVLYELAQQRESTATALVAALSIDHGYLSRILRAFEERDLIARRRSKDDGRQAVISLTTRGHKAFASLDHRSQRETGGLLKHLDEAAQARVVAAMETIEQLIEAGATAQPHCTIRSHRPGDMGWVVQRHGTLYASEYGWGTHIEAITAEIVGSFLKNFDAACEHCWIAEMDGEIVGSVFLVKESEGVARLRLLIVDPKARGLGLGRELVERCIAFAREAGYRKITLWTHGILTAARAIYQKTGFRLVRQWVHEDFGKPEPSETWELTL